MKAPMEYRHSTEDGLESYAFVSALDSKHRHLVDRVDDGPWTVWPIDRVDPMPIEDAQIFVREVTALVQFAENLTRPNLHRNTTPGEPELAGIGGGL